MTWRHLQIPCFSLPGRATSFSGSDPSKACLRPVIQIDARLSETKFYLLAVRSVE
jgi:hypothetical protein